MIPKTLPAGTTQEQWERYELDQKNHESRIQNKRDFLQAVIDYSTTHTLTQTYEHFAAELDMAQSMDAPDEPGYYRANND